MLPSNVLVVVDTLFEAGVQNADPSIRQLANGLAVGLAPPSQFVVVGARTQRPGDRAEGPLVEGVGQTSVAHVASQDDVALARGPRDR